MSKKVIQNLNAFSEQLVKDIELKVNFQVFKKEILFQDKFQRKEIVGNWVFQDCILAYFIVSFTFGRLR